MVTFNSDVILSAEALSLGETVRIHCPTCRGNRPTLTITRQDDGSIVWNCYRASCDERGGRGGHRSHAAKSLIGKERKRKITPYEGDIRVLHEDERQFLADTIGWDETCMDIGRAKWAEDEDRYAFPVYDPMGKRRGWVMRTWAETWKPKALTRMDVDEPHLSWYRLRPQRELWIVEDIPSAVRAAKYVNSVALCGTGCGPDYALEIAAHQNAVVWALDADATAHAIRLHNKHRALFNSSRVRPIPCDLKDMDEDQLKEVLDG